VQPQTHLAVEQPLSQWSNNMGLFSNVEINEDESRGGFLSRLRTPRASLVEPGNVSEPRFKSAVKPTKARGSFLGRSRSGDYVEDESTQLSDSPRGTPEPVAVEVVEREAQNTRSFECVPVNIVPDDVRQEGHDSLHSTLESQNPTYARLRWFDRSGTDTGATGLSATDANDHNDNDSDNDNDNDSDSDNDDDNEATAPIEMPGRPTLVSAESLPDFKRILSSTEADAALKISVAARKEFIAVELQPGIALVAATARFCERAQFATFLKDLAANDLVVNEEMVATEEVIASIYAGKRDSGTGGVRESSRAIGNFRDLLEAAHFYNASDVHFEPRDFKTEVEVRFRVNGDLYTYRHLPKAIVRRALSAAYSDLVQKNTNSGNAFQPTSPQSAMIPLVLRKDTVNLRWQSSPSVGGYDVVLRLLDGNFKHYSVRLPDQMGLAPSQLELIETLNYVSRGITVLTGETGSGKTTLLRALSYMLPDRDLKKQFAVSEPAEYPQPWLSEYSIIRRPDETDAEANRKYAEVIRTLMREDPDDLTIGEVRDHVVMGLVAELALTGHPVRFSLHAGDIISAVMRMAGGRLQLPIDELAAEGFINAVGNQKLVPTLCENCKIPAADVMKPADLEVLEKKFGLDTSKMACRDTNGCKKCRLEGLFTRLGKVAGGTTGQTLVAEFYRPTPEFLDHVSVRDWAGARRVWRGERKTSFDNEDMTGKTLYEHALLKASRGDIDPQFINRSMQSFAQYRVMPGVDGLE